jgi:hypothetical protein
MQSSHYNGQLTGQPIHHDGRPREPDHPYYGEHLVSTAVPQLPAPGALTPRRRNLSRKWVVTCDVSPHGHNIRSECSLYAPVIGSVQAGARLSVYPRKRFQPAGVPWQVWIAVEWEGAGEATT